MSDLFVAFLFGMVGGVLGSLAQRWGLLQKVYSLETLTNALETRITDIHERLTTEMKKRASRTSQAQQQWEKELAAHLPTQPAPEPKPSALWWMQPMTK